MGIPGVDEGNYYISVSLKMMSYGEGAGAIGGKTITSIQIPIGYVLESEARESFDGFVQESV